MNSDTQLMVTEADEFTRGYLIAVSNLIGGFGVSTQSSELLGTIDATPALVRKFGFSEYDRANLSEGIRYMKGAI